MEKYENQTNEKVTVEKVEETTERMEGSINEVVKEKPDRVEAIKKELSTFVDKAGQQIENLDTNGLIEKIKKLFETKPLQSIGISLAIFLVVFFGVRKLTSDPLNGTYELLNRREHVIMVIKGNSGTIIYEDSNGNKNQGSVQIDRQKKEMTISSPQITSTSKTKYILKDKDLYLQEPNETLTRTE